ncbi:MAG: Crp/Fnr family transcriptional regulator [Clostridium sp.]|nr:Crp/Fnr family transcriptional regulator [Clostridium sp.]
MKRFNLYENHMDLSPLIDLLHREGKAIHLAKNEVFARQGFRLRHWGLVTNGYFKYMATDTDGNLHVTGFALAHSIVGEFLSLVENEPNPTDIIAATPVDVLVCDVKAVRRLLENHPDFTRSLSISLFRQAYSLYLDTHLHNPRERYLALLERCPDLLNTISLKELSSFLQITPTHLSRIRKEITFEEK